ncbi:MAG TPA: TolC family protein [Coxiellaceae bacterium]|nr:TolC family protein [Coxiellaceae bacterium]
MRCLTKKIFVAASLLISALLAACGTMDPKPLADDEQLQISELLKQVYQQQPAVHNTLSLSEAIARALKYNLNTRLQEANSALASGQLTLAKWQTLPALNFTYDAYHRDNAEQQQLVGSNGQLTTNTSSVTPQTIRTQVAGLNWNILNFGVSYLSAKQQANKVLISLEEQRKIEQQLVGDVIVSYIKAYGAQENYTQMQNTMSKANKALTNSSTALKLQLAPTQQQLRYQQSVLQNLRRLSQLKSTLSQAKYDLAALTNLPARTNYKLINPNFKLPPLYDSAEEAKKVDLVAIVNRPEIRQSSYQLRNAIIALTQAKLNILPGVTVNYAYNYTSNYYYVNQKWMSLDVQAAWNLIQLLSGPSQTLMARSQIEVARIQNLALTVGVLTQIRLSYLQYQGGLEDYRYAQNLADVDDKLYKYAKKLKSADVGSENTLIESAVESLNANLEKNLAEAAVFDAYRKMYQSVGISLVTIPQQTDDLETSAKLIQKSLDKNLQEGFASRIDQEYAIIEADENSNSKPKTER